MIDVDDFGDGAGQEAKSAARGDDAEGGISTIENEHFAIEAFAFVEGERAARGDEIVYGSVEGCVRDIIFEIIIIEVVREM